MPKVTLAHIGELRKKYSTVRLAKPTKTELLKQYNQVFNSLGGKRIFRTLPPPSTTLTPIAPASADGGSYLNLGTSGGSCTWDARPTADQPTGIIYMPDGGVGNITMTFATVPGTKYVMELQVLQGSDGLSVSWALFGWEGEINSTIDAVYSPTVAQDIITGFTATVDSSHIALSCMPHYAPSDLIRGGQVGLFFSAKLTPLS